MFSIRKQKNGRYTFLAIASNNYTDSDEEIITEAAHEDYVRRFDAGEISHAALLFPWHEPSPTGVIKAVGVHQGFLLIAGEFFDEFDLIAEGLAKSEGYGISIGVHAGDYARDPVNRKHIINYTLAEASYLPVTRASNGLTLMAASDGLTKEYTMKLTDEKRKMFEDLVGPENLAQVLETVQKYHVLAKEQGILSKEATEGAADEAEEIIEDTVSDEAATVETVVEEAEEIVEPTGIDEVISEYVTTKELTAAVSEIAKAVKESVDALTGKFQAELDAIRKEAADKSASVEKSRKSGLSYAALLSEIMSPEGPVAKEDVIVDGDALDKAAPKEAEAEQGLSPIASAVFSRFAK
jgi:hypothetical protein